MHRYAGDTLQVLSAGNHDEAYDAGIRREAANQTGRERDWRSGNDFAGLSPEDIERNNADKWSPNIRDHGPYRLVHQSPTYGSGQITAHVQDSRGWKGVGYLSYTRRHDLEGTPTEIHKVQVHPDHQRRGLASAMLDLARESHPEMQHSRALSDDGRAWAEKKASRLPKILYKGVSARALGEIQRSGGLQPSEMGESGPGIYLTHDHEYAKRYAGMGYGGGAVLHVEHSVQNPLVRNLDDKDDPGEKKYRHIQDMTPGGTINTGGALGRALAEHGHDSVETTWRGRHEIAVHDPAKLRIVHVERVDGEGNPRTAVQAPPPGLSFTHDEFDTGGSKYPTRIHLRAHTPEDGQVGALIYHPPKRRNGIVSVYNLHVEPDHRRRGIGSALMDEMQRRHPDSTIDHGDRTFDGEDWWSGYTDGKTVRRGRTANRIVPCTHCKGRGTFSNDKGQSWACPTCGGDKTLEMADHWDPPELPQEQRDALAPDDHSTYSRRALQLAKSPVPGTVVWRGEVRHKDDLDRPPSVGMHWSVKPEQASALHPPTDMVPEDHHKVLWEARIDDAEKQTIPRSHPVWHGRYQSMDSEAEVRFKPGTKVHLQAAYVHDGRDSRRSTIAPQYSDRSAAGWTKRPMDHEVPVEHKRSRLGQGDDGLMDYREHFPDLFKSGAVRMVRPSQVWDHIRTDVRPHRLDTIRDSVAEHGWQPDWNVADGPIKVTLDPPAVSNGSHRLHVLRELGRDEPIPMQVSASLSDEDRVSVAEQAMERGGHTGQSFHVPAERWSFGDPVPESHREVHDYVNGALQAAGHPGRVRIQPKDWNLREPGTGQAYYDGTYNKIGLAGEDTHELTLLHEMAHAITHTSHTPSGHGHAFQQAAHGLYERHLGPQAAAVFRNVLGPSQRHEAVTENWPPHLTEREDEYGDTYPVNVSRSNPRGPVATESEARAAGLVGPYFHGTNKRRARQIRSEGFRQPRLHNYEMHGAGNAEEVDFGNTHRTYFANTHDEAMHFARGHHGDDADVVTAYLHPDHIEHDKGGGWMPSVTVKDVTHATAIRSERKQAAINTEHIRGQDVPDEGQHPYAPAEDDHPKLRWPEERFSLRHLPIDQVLSDHDPHCVGGRHGARCFTSGLHDFDEEDGGESDARYIHRMAQHAHELPALVMRPDAEKSHNFGGMHRLAAWREAGQSHVPAWVPDKHLDQWGESQRRKATRTTPHDRVFGPTYGLDSDLFTVDQKLKPEIRSDLVGKFTRFCLVHGYRDWASWTKIYFAGSEASTWTSPELQGNGDFDILVGIEYRLFRQANPAYRDMSNVEISQMLTEQMHHELNDSTYHPAGVMR